VESVDAGITQALKYCADYMGIGIDEVDVELNRDFIASQMDSKSLIDLIKAYQEGGISEETLYYQLHKGEILPPDHNKQEEIERLQGLKQPVEQQTTVDSEPVMADGVEGHPPVQSPQDLVTHMRQMIEDGMSNEEIIAKHSEFGRFFS
jgi:hypothetical protein